MGTPGTRLPWKGDKRRWRLSSDGKIAKLATPSDADMRATEKPDPWPKKWSAFLKCVLIATLRLFL
jgi:hypothetical protein